MTLTVVGVPIPKNRPRFKIIRGRPRVYDTQGREARAFADEIYFQWRQGPLSGPLVFLMRFYMPIPKRTSKNVRELIKAGKYWHIVKPDVSNLIKFVEDACEGILFDNDKQLVVVHGQKIYDDLPRTEVDVYELK